MEGVADGPGESGLPPRPHPASGSIREEPSVLRPTSEYSHQGSNPPGPLCRDLLSLPFFARIRPLPPRLINGPKFRPGTFYA